MSSGVTYVRDEDLLDEPVPRARVPRRAPPGRRRLTALGLAAAGLPLLTLGLDAVRDTVSLESVVLLYLLAVILVALVGGVTAALVAAFTAASLINWYFVAPLHTFDVSRGEQLLSLVVFLVVAGIVSGAVEVAQRRERTARRAAAQAETLSSLAAGDPRQAETLSEVLESARRAFTLDSVALLVREPGQDGWTEAERAGRPPSEEEAPLRFDVPVGPRTRLVGRGHPVFAEDQRLLRAFAASAQTAREGRRLEREAGEARTLAAVDRQRTALLAAVGHDLRTPLAGVKAAVSSLRQTDIAWTETEREELLGTIEDSADRLDAVVANLLDASRLQAGELSVRSRPTDIEEVVGTVLLGLGEAGEGVSVEVPDDMPLVLADPGLLERVLHNLVANAVQHAGGPGAVRVVARPTVESARIEVVDRGPGVAPEQREAIFTPFRRLDDRGSGGVGLGLAVARGFTEAMGGALVADEAPEGGLVMRLRLPLAPAPPAA